MTATEHLDRRVRAFIFDGLMTSGTAPTIDETAARFGAKRAAVLASFQRLADARMVILQTSGEVMAANPFANVWTPFLVESGERRYTAMCVWDALGIPAMLKANATIRTTCGDCNDAIDLAVEDGALKDLDAVVHFAVPAKRWWENIVFS
jgi:Alkylmercury lyase